MGRFSIGSSATKFRHTNATPSWTSEEIEQLWDDLQDAIREDRPDYFLGSIVVQEDRDAKLRIIIDGQQRLAALTMIFSAIRTVYAEQQPKDERAEEVYSDFLGQRDRRTRMVEPFISMNEVNEPFFRKLVVADVGDGDLRAAASDKTLSKSNILLAKALQFFRSQVRKATRAVANYENFLLQLEEFVSNRVVAIMVRVSDEADAYLIFETLNDRGLELSSSDLLKNYIFGRAGQYLDTVRNQWREMVLLLGTGNETQFVRHYWLSKFGVVRDRDLFKEMKLKFSSQSAVLGLMSELRSAADKYAAISSVDNPIWQGYGSSVRRQIEVLKEFDLSQFRPLLLAALDQLEEQQVAKVINVILMVSMRYSIIGSLGPGNIEKAYSDAAIAIRRSDVDTAAKIFSLLKNIYPDDQRFEEDFASKSVPKSDLARYILSEIENHVRGESMLAVNEDEKVTTIEHIMPKGRSGAWGSCCVGRGRVP